MDLVPIKPIRNVVTFTEDITTQKCYAALSKELDGHAVDLVSCAPSRGLGAAYRLIEGCKRFRSYPMARPMWAQPGPRMRSRSLR